MTSTSYQTCYPETILPSLIINGSVSLCVLTVCIFVLCKICRPQKKYSEQEVKFRTLDRALYLFYGICVVHSICNAPYLLSNCFTVEMGGVWAATALRLIRYGAYIYHWATLLSVFFFRINISFKSTVLELNKCHHRAFVVLLCGITLLFAFNVTALVSGAVAMSRLTSLTAILVLSLTAYSQFLAFVFVRKLFILHTLSDPDRFLLDAITRHSIIANVSFLSSTAVVIAAIFLGSDRFAESSIAWRLLAGRSSQSLDVLTDVLCVTLGLNSFDRHYRIFCGAADSKCRSCCASIADRRSRKHERTLAADTAASVAGTTEMATC